MYSPAPVKSPNKYPPPPSEIKKERTKQTAASFGRSPDNDTIEVTRQIDDSTFGLSKSPTIKRERITYIRSVMTTAAIHLLIVTALVFAIDITRWNTIDRVFSNRYLTALAIIGYLISVFGLSYHRETSVKTPINYILFGILSVSLTYIIAALGLFYHSRIPLFLITTICSMFVGLMVYALTNEHSFNHGGSLAFIIFTVVISSIALAQSFRDDSRWVLPCALISLLLGLYVVYFVRESAKSVRNYKYGLYSCAGMHMQLFRLPLTLIEATRQPEH